jgi:GT2 family glycosyltransferase
VAASTGVTVRTVVIDDRSTDRTAELARAGGAEVIPTPPPGGLGVARNVALDACRTRYLGFLNADCYPEPDWLAQLCEAAATTGAAVVGGRQDELRSFTAAERWKALHLRQDLGNQVVEDPDYLSGGNLVLDLDQVGELRFAAGYTIAYEDVDFCRRLRSAGRRLHYFPSAMVWHDHEETLRTLPRKVWSYGAFSRSVGEYSSVFGALRAAVRMHRRPHDQLRNALRDDLRRGRVGFVALDLFLFAASLRLFLINRRGQHATRTVPPASLGESG